MKETSIRILVSWGISVILAWSFISNGYLKLAPDHASEYQNRFIAWGYDPAFATQIGIFEIVIGVLVLLPWTASLAGAMGLVIMAGACYTHWTTGIGSAAFSLILLVLSAGLLILRWPESIQSRILGSK